MKVKLLMLLILVSGAFASFDVSPDGAVKIGDDVTITIDYNIDLIKWEVVENDTGAITCFKGVNGSEPISCSDLTVEHAQIDMVFDGSDKYKVVDCSIGVNTHQDFPGYNLLNVDSEFNTTKYTQSYMCQSSDSFEVQSNVLPNSTIPFNVSAKAFENTEEEHTGIVPVQEVILTLDSIPPSSNGRFTLNGLFEWEDGTKLVNKPIEMTGELCDLVKVFTSTSGEFSAVCEYDDYLESDTYDVIVNAFYSLEYTISKETTVQTRGLTEVDFDVPTTTFNVSTGGSVKVPFTWIIGRGTQIDEVNIRGSFPATNKTFIKTCPPETGTDYDTCNDEFIITAPMSWGVFPLTIWAIWDDERGNSYNEEFTVMINVPKESTFVLDKTQFIMDRVVGELTTTSIRVTSIGNTNSTLSIVNSDNLYAIDSEGAKITSFVVPANGDKALPLTMVIPYDTDEVQSGMLTLTNEFGITRNVTYTFTPLTPALEWDVETKQNVSNPTLTIPLTLLNKGEAAKHVAIDMGCPDFWTCEIVPSSFDNMHKGDAKEVFLNLTLAYVEDIDNKTLTISAIDQAGRSADVTIDLVLNPITSVKVGELTVTTTINKDRFDDEKYYFVSDGGLVERTVLSDTNLEARVKRNSLLSAWTVTSTDESIGLGDVCDVYIYVNGKSYKIDADPNVLTPLTGDVNDLAYEYLVIHKQGTCRVRLDYGDIDTLTYVEVTGQPLSYTGQFTWNEIESMIHKTSDSELDPIKEGAFWLVVVFLFAVAMFIYWVVVYQRKGRILHKPKNKTILIQGNIRGIAEKTQSSITGVESSIRELFKTQKQKDKDIETKDFGKFFAELDNEDVPKIGGVNNG